MSTVGLQRAHDGQQVAPAARPQAVRRGQRVRPGQLAPVVLGRPFALDHQAVGVEDGDRARRPSSPARPGAPQRVAQEARDADAGRARAQDHDALRARAACRATRVPRQDARQRHRRRALDVVVEGRQDARGSGRAARRRCPCGSPPTAGAPAGSAASPRARTRRRSASYSAPRSRGCAPADVEVVVEQRLVVGADVEADGQRLRGMDAGGRGVERELADGDAHAARALVAEAEDALVVGDHDEAHVLEGRVAEHLVDAAAVPRA